MARGLEFQISKVEGLYYLCSEKIKTLISFAVTCAFVFAYAKRSFSHDAAHLSVAKMVFFFVEKSQYLLIFAQNIYCVYSLEPPYCGFNE